MRKALLVFALVALSISACASTVVKESTVPVAWDAPVTDETGRPLLPEDVLSYQVWIEDMLTAARTAVAVTTALEATVTVPYRSTWRIGVSALLDGLESAIAWSTVVADVQAGETFVLRPKATPAKPAGLEVP